MSPGRPPMKTRSAGFLVALGSYVLVLALHAQEKPRLDGLHQLIGRHPAVYSNGAFRDWVSTNGGATWHEERDPNSGNITVVIQPAKEQPASVFASLVKPRVANGEESVLKATAVPIPADFTREQAVEKL